MAQCRAGVWPKNPSGNGRERVQTVSGVAACPLASMGGIDAVRMLYRVGEGVVSRRGGKRGRGGAGEAIMALRALGLVVLVSAVSRHLACADLLGCGAGVGAVHRDKVGEAVDACVRESDVRSARWSPG